MDGKQIGKMASNLASAFRQWASKEGAEWEVDESGPPVNSATRSFTIRHRRTGDEARVTVSAVPAEETEHGSALRHHYRGSRA